MKVVSLNIEGDKHFNRWPNAIKEFSPEIVCFQEVFSVNIPTISSLLNMELVSFAPLLRVEEENQYSISPLGLWGIAVFAPSKSMVQSETYYYYGSEEVARFSLPNDASRAVIVSSLDYQGEKFVIANTHFTWSPGGESTKEQLRDAKALRDVMSRYPEYVLCGDVNAPRERETFALLSEGLTSYIPESVATTIDPDLHYAGPLQLVVDTVLATDAYAAKVDVRSGLSDHQGLFFEVERKA